MTRQRAPSAWCARLLFCALFGVAFMLPPGASAKGLRHRLRDPAGIANAAAAGERADADLPHVSSDGKGGPFMGVPRAPLNMSRGVDFPFGDSRPTNKNFLNVYKLKQLRDYVFFGEEGRPSPVVGSRETPIGLRAAHVLLQMSWNCVAHYHPVALEFHTLAAPPNRAKGTDAHSAHNDANRLVCIAAAWWRAAGELLSERDQKLIRDFIIDDMRLFPTKPASSANGDDDDMTKPGSLNSLPLDDPRVVAGIRVADDVMAYVRDDGWNSDGREGGREDNLRPYQDYTGYTPAPHSGDGLVGADPRRWVPLPETDEEGFFFVQKHVTPQIGSKARTYLVSEAELAERHTDVPKYNLTAEALAVVRRTANRLNDTEKMLIELADAKFILAESFLDPMAYRNGWGITEGVFFEVMSNTGVVDALVLSWRDKLRNDHVRPTSVVHSFLGNNTLTAWKGPGAGQGAVKGRDWQPYIRVMPHSEHPSGSSCICAALFDAARITLGRDEYTTVVDFPKGSSVVEPGVTPATDLTWTARTLTEMEDMCGASRLWGGMHFPGAVPAGKELCSGLGEKAYRRGAYLVSGGDKKFCTTDDCSEMKPAFRNPHQDRVKVLSNKEDR